MASLVRSDWGRTAVLVGLLSATALLVGPLAFLYDQWNGLFSAGVALAVCLGSGLASLWTAHLLRAPDQVLYQVLLGMFPRMGFPLIACMIVILQRGMLAEAGFVYYIMAFYFVTLAAETVLMAIRLSPEPNETQAG